MEGLGASEERREGEAEALRCISRIVIRITRSANQAGPYITL